MSTTSSSGVPSGIPLNLHHLRYFREIARTGNLTRAARRLKLSPGALSIQIKQLEEHLSHSLFNRSRAGMALTEAGRVALEYAEMIHKAGSEMLDVLRHQPATGKQILRVGTVATLSRNFLLEFLRPCLGRTDMELLIRSGSLRELILWMHSHQVDLALTNQALRRDSETVWHSHLLARQTVSLVGKPHWKRKRKNFPHGMEQVPLILPSVESHTRVEFDRIMASAGVTPYVLAEVDDMATLRLLAREADALALVPPVVVRDEIKRGELCEVHPIRGLQEMFYAVTPNRRFPNPMAHELVERMSKKSTR